MTQTDRTLGAIDALLAKTEDVLAGLRDLREEVQGQEANGAPALFCRLFADSVAAYARRPRVTATWETEARRLFENDGVSPEDAGVVLRWLTEHDGREANFWRSNVLSVPTFRKQWDRLVLAMRQDANRLQREGNGRAGRLLAMAKGLPKRGETR